VRPYGATHHDGGVATSGRRLWRLVVLAVAVVLIGSNLLGAAVALILGIFVIPLPGYESVEPRSAVFFLVATACYVAIAIPVGTILGARGHRTVRRWLLEDRPATLREQRTVLRTPIRLFLLQWFFWLGAAALFSVLSSGRGFVGSLWVAVLVTLVGATTAASTYLIAERILRPVATRALSDGAQGDFRVSGIRRRFFFAWMLGTAVPVVGLLMVGLVSLSTSLGTRQEVLVATIVLSGIALVIGFWTVGAAAGATAGPIIKVADAMRKVEDGDLDVQVSVHDATETGQLQVGFNAMVAGLRERERLREAFGTYMDPTVAKHILEQGTDLAGEELEVTVMFLDVRGFTRFASDVPATEVVARLNALFEEVVPIVREHEGHVDKFVGDGVLAVFGAPRREERHADLALTAALAIAAAVSEGLEDLEVGIGLNSGPVVAGNVGGGGRLEFTVIGDVVNVAARIEAATRETGDTILLSQRTRELAHEPPDLVERTGVRLRGKDEEVTLYAPASLDPATRS
jgi:adenylate cyclase